MTFLSVFLCDRVRMSWITDARPAYAFTGKRSALFSTKNHPSAVLNAFLLHLIEYFTQTPDAGV